VDKPVVVCVRTGGEIALPADVCHRHNLDETGALVRLVEREDGVIELHPIPADQAWFWTPEWQEGEREVDEHIARGEIEVFNRTAAPPLNSSPERTSGAFVGDAWAATTLLPSRSRP